MPKSLNIKKLRQYGWLSLIVLLGVLAFAELSRLAGVPGKTSFWGDEIASVTFAVQPNLREALRWQATYEGSGPVFNIILYVWLRLMPYGDKYLLLLPQIFAALSVVAVGLAVKEALGARYGAAASAAMLLNTRYLWYGNELRTYTLTCLVAALLMWVYFKRLDDESGINLAGFSLLAALLVYTHYCAVFVVFILFAADFVLFIKKQARKRVIIPYIGAGVMFLPWLFYYLKNSKFNPWAFIDVTIPDAVGMGYALFGENRPLVFMAIIAVVTLALDMTEQNRSKQVNIKQHTSDKGIVNQGEKAKTLIAVAVSVGFVTVMFVVSKVLFVMGKGAFWVYRYFICAIPFCVFVAISGFKRCVSVFGEKQNYITTVLIISLCFLWLPPQYIELKKENWADWLQNSAEYLYQQEDIFDNRVGVYNNLGPALLGWQQYYVEKLGERQPFNYVDFDGSLEGIDKLYTVECHVAMSWQLNILNEQFDLVGEDNDTHVKIWMRKAIG